MKANKDLALSYAEALFELSREKGVLDEDLERLLVLKSVLNEPKVRNLILDPKVDSSVKEAAIEKALKGSPEHFVAWSKMAVRKRILKNIDGICGRFLELYDEEKGIKRGIVYSVVPLSEKEIGELSKSISRDGLVRLENKLDPSLIGGYRIYLGGRLIDLSVKGKIEGIVDSLLTKGAAS